MKRVIVMLAVAAAGIIGLVIYASLQEPEKPDPELGRINRRAYAQSFQDRMRDDGYGPSLTAEAVGPDFDILELGINGCNTDALRTITASPKIQGIFNDLGFYRIRCKVGSATVARPWTY